MVGTFVGMSHVAGRLPLVVLTPPRRADSRRGGSTQDIGDR